MELQARHDGAVSATQFAAAMEEFRLGRGARVAVAVSGGADSLALAHLLVGWAAGRGISVFALTVDHRLRENAAAEAAQVGAWLAPLGISHETLPWTAGAAHRGLDRSAQKDAREARYCLMTDWCAANDCAHLFVAHHADDQVETFLLRLSRGSGVDGLAAMAASSVRDGIVVARPLLAFTKAQLVAVCRDVGQEWIEDPSNRNPASARVRFRDAQALLEREGLTRERLLATVAHLQRARAALDYAVGKVLDAVTWDQFGMARLPLAEMLAAPEEIALRALSRLLMAASGQGYGPRFESLSDLHTRLTTGPWSDASLHGCLISRGGGDFVISREPAAVTDEKLISPGKTVMWDGRFKLALQAPAGMTFTIARVADGAHLPDSARTKLAQVPYRLRGTIPALFDSVGVAVVPQAGFVRDDIAAVPGFCLAITHVFEGDAKL